MTFKDFERQLSADMISGVFEERRKNIILIGPAPPFRGGIAQFNASLHSGLRDRGHTARVVTFSRQYPTILFPGKTQLEPSGGKTSAEPLIDSVNPASWWHTAARIVRMRPDAAVFQYWLPFFAPAYGTIAGRLRKHGTRVLGIVHNVFPHERRPGDLVLTRYFFRRCSSLIALSDAVADDVRSVHATADVRSVSHPTYVHFGEPPTREAARRDLGLDDEEEVLLFFGFVRRYKGLHVLLNALPAVVEKRPRIRLLIAGEFYENEAEYRALIEQNGLAKRVRLEDTYIPQGRVPLYFAAADLIVQPYVSATQSGVVQTAYHFDRPVVVTDVGGLAEVVPHGIAGLVVPPNRPDALAESIIRFFEEGLADELGAGVRREKRKHSWDRLLDVIEELSS